MWLGCARSMRSELLKRCGTQQGRSEVVRMYALRGGCADERGFWLKIVCLFVLFFVMFAVWWKLFNFCGVGWEDCTVEELRHQNFR